jgi:hypothetical protein
MGENMDVIEIIKDAFVFPSKDIKMLLIYELLAVIAGAFSIVGTILYMLGVVTPELFMWGGIACIIAMLIGWVLSGYLVSVTKSGIDIVDEVPEFEWWENFITGFNYFIVSIVYFIIPAFIVLVAGYLTNVYGNAMVVGHEIVSQAATMYATNSTFVVTNVMSQAMVNLVISLATTLTVAVVVFVIFSFLQTIAGARLANTGSLMDALNIMETAKDISRIGIFKVIVVILLVIIIVAIIEMILSAIFARVPLLSILSIIITPYLIFFVQRSVGLLYSDIA